MTFVIEPISPIAFSILGFNIRWYALAYIISFIIGFILFKNIIKKSNFNISKKQLDDLLSYVILGVIIGGRLGYVLFYNLSFFISNPLEIFALWNGGMSFHGGILGFVLGVFLFVNKSIKEKVLYNSFFILDRLTLVAPIGLFFGRIANFINMELMGRITNNGIGVVFKGYETLPRHPSPIYEALTEGFLLFVIMNIIYKYTKLKERVGTLSGIFAILYSVFRIFCEQFREPDSNIGFLTNFGLTMGQLLSLVLFIIGITIFIVAFRKNNFKIR